MSPWFLLRVRAAWLAGVTLAVAGLLPVVYFAGLLAWQVVGLFQARSWTALPATLAFTDHAQLQKTRAAPVLDLIPEWPWPWLMSPDAWLPAHQALTWVLERVHLALVPALLGAALGALGVLLVRWQAARLELERRRTEDRLRRVRLYRHDARAEPFIGPGGTSTDDREPALHDERRRSASAR